MNVARAVAMIALLTVTSCSWIGVRVDPQRPPPARSSCPLAAPIADTVGAVWFDGIAGGLVVATLVSQDPYVGLAAGVIGLPAAILGTLYTLSARYGWRARCTCRRLFDEPAR